MRSSNHQRTFIPFVLLILLLLFPHLSSSLYQHPHPKLLTTPEESHSSQPLLLITLRKPRLTLAPAYLRDCFSSLLASAPKHSDHLLTCQTMLKSSCFQTCAHSVVSLEQSPCLLPWLLGTELSYLSFSSHLRTSALCKASLGRDLAAPTTLSQCHALTC